MALLFKLRSLAGRKKNLRAEAEKALYEQWQTRLSRLGIMANAANNECMFITTAVPRDFGKAGNPLQYCEETIQENIYGLCLADAISADRIVRGQKRIAKALGKGKKKQRSEDSEDGVDDSDSEATIASVRRYAIDPGKLDRTIAEEKSKSSVADSGG